MYLLLPLCFCDLSFLRGDGVHVPSLVFCWDCQECGQKSFGCASRKVLKGAESGERPKPCASAGLHPRVPFVKCACDA